MSLFKLRIGVEGHAKLLTKQKLFSPAKTTPSLVPNTQVSLFDVATPGTYPVINLEAVHLAIRAALSLGCSISKTLAFDRKHYEYADLPHGYQLTQHRHPIGVGGSLMGHAIKQVHLEVDSAKKIITGLDYNRAGVGLIEIVSEPCFESAKETIDFCTELRDHLRTIRISDGLMEKGSLRFDINVSSGDHRTRCEIKNLNSFEAIQQAVSDANLGHFLEGGENCTLSFEHGILVKTRSKQSHGQYRYIPEYDIPDQVLSEEFVSSIKCAMPLSPNELRQRLATIVAIPNIEKLISSQLAAILIDYVDAGVSPSRAFNVLTNVVMGKLNSAGLDTLDVEESFFSRLRELLILNERGSVSDAVLKETIPKMLIDIRPWHAVACLDAQELLEGHLSVLQELVRHDRFSQCQQSGNFDFLIGLALGLFKKTGLPRANPKLVFQFFKAQNASSK